MMLYLLENTGLHFPWYMEIFESIEKMEIHALYSCKLSIKHIPIILFQ